MSAGRELRCPSCRERTPAGRFCIHCGVTTQPACPACGEAVVSGARFCLQCGSPLTAAVAAAVAAAPAPIVAERRLVSVLFADLVGFTALSEWRDPEEVRDLLSMYFDRCRVLIERYGGTVEKFIGDAVMAVWGTPVAREDDAERAVRAALSLTQAVALLGEEMAMAELRIRAGVLTGSAAVEVGGETEGMVLGDTVNTASRLQSLAAPGTVLVDDVTRRACEASIEYEDAGVHEVKGREQPVHAFTAVRVVAGVRGARRRAGLEAPFVGRDAELQTIIEVAEDTVEHRTARLVTVTGDAGLGKSRLLWEFFKYIDGIEEVRWWHQGRCLAYGEGVSYWALAEMVRTRAGISEEDSPATERSKLQVTIERFVTSERERQLVEPRLAQLLGLEQRSPGEAADLFAGWRLFFERMADTQPVVLAFEDLQWADSGLLDFIDYVLEWSADYPIFILALGRPELESRRPNWGTAARLGALTPSAMQALLDGLVPGLPADLGARVLERAEGVPLYAVETVRMLLDRGVLTQEGNRYVVSGTVADLEVPETLQALTAARLDNLDGAERKLLQDAAVLGMSFTPAALAAVAERRETDVRRGLDALVTKQVLGRDDDPRSAEPGQYHFLQALLRTVALGTLSRRDRKARHLGAAEHLRAVSGDAPEMAEVLASHYLDAVAADPDAPDVDDIRGRARETLVAAGHRAVSLALGAEARVYFERAASLADDETDRASLLAEAGAAAARTADRQDALQLLGDAIAVLEASGRTQEAALTRARLAEVLIDENRLDEAAQLLDGAREMISDPAALAQLASRRARVAFLRGDYRRAREDAELALSIADPRRLPAVVAEAAMTKAIALNYDGRLTEGEALMSLGLQVAVEADIGEQMLRGYYNLADARHMAGHSDEAVELIDSGLVLARERGNRAWERDLQAQSVQIRLLRGEWDHALAVIDALKTGGDDEAVRVVASQEPVIFAARGQTADLQAHLARSVPRSEWQELAELEDLGNGLALATIGRLREGAALMAGVVPDLIRMNTSSKAVYLIEVAETLLNADQIDVVTQLIGDEELRSPSLIEAQLWHARAMLHLRAGELEPAERELERATRTLRAAGAPFLLARCLTGYGDLLIELGRVDEAAALLQEARAAFVALRATPWIERVDALLEPVAAP